MGRRNRTRSERRKRNAERRRTAMRWTLDARRYATVTLRAVAAAMCVAVLVAWWAVDRVGPDGAVLGGTAGGPGPGSSDGSSPLTDWSRPRPS